MATILAVTAKGLVKLVYSFVTGAQSSFLQHMETNKRKGWTSPNFLYK